MLLVVLGYCSKKIQWTCTSILKRIDFICRICRSHVIICHYCNICISFVNSTSNFLRLLLDAPVFVFPWGPVWCIAFGLGLALADTLDFALALVGSTSWLSLMNMRKYHIFSSPLLSFRSKSKILLMRFGPPLINCNIEGIIYMIYLDNNHTFFF